MRIAVVPSAPALLPAYAGLRDPLPDVRAAALAACAWLAEGADAVTLLAADPLGARVGRALLDAAGWTEAVDGLGVDAQTAGSGRGTAVLVVADGTARRGEKAPGHLDPRAHAYDEQVGRALATADAAALRALDPDLGADLLAAGVPALRTLGRLAAGWDVADATVDYGGDPFGVAYWVVRWTCGS